MREAQERFREFSSGLHVSDVEVLKTLAITHLCACAAETIYYTGRKLFLRDLENRRAQTHRIASSRCQFNYLAAAASFAIEVARSEPQQ